MPDVQNVFRRGGAYWWRSTLSWLDGNTQPITLAFSLGTKDLGVARHRAAAMTAQSEVVRMGLYERVARDGLTVEQRDAVFRTEMGAYRDGLEHLSAAWQFKPAWAKVTDVDCDLRIYEAIWSAFAKTGVLDGVPTRAYMDEHFDDLTDEQRTAARHLVGSVEIRSDLSRGTAQRLEALSIEPNPTNMALAVRLVMNARAQAARGLRLGVERVGTTAMISRPIAARAAVAGVAAALEIIDSRYRDFKFSLTDVVADNSSSSALAVGPWADPATDLSNLGMILEIDGVARQIGSSAAILGNPIRSLVAAARLAARAGEPLRAGDIVMAGGATAAEHLAPGNHVRIEVQTIGRAEFRVN